MTVCDVVGTTLFALGLVLEAVSDQQKFNFRNNPANRGRWCDSGVWGWSRHPNYCGEASHTNIEERDSTNSTDLQVEQGLK